MALIQSWCTNWLEIRVIEIFASFKPIIFRIVCLDPEGNTISSNSATFSELIPGLSTLLRLEGKQHYFSWIHSLENDFGTTFPTVRSTFSANLSDLMRFDSELCFWYLRVGILFTSKSLLFPAVVQGFHLIEVLKKRKKN